MLTQGKLRCRVCGRIFGAMMTRELDELDAHLRAAANFQSDGWNGSYPRPSVIRRLVDEVRTRRALGEMLYRDADRPIESMSVSERLLNVAKEPYTCPSCGKGPDAHRYYVLPLPGGGATTKLRFCDGTEVDL